jgi:hypothetical protein
MFSPRAAQALLSDMQLYCYGVDTSATRIDEEPKLRNRKMRERGNVNTN